MRRRTGQDQTTSTEPSEVEPSTASTNKSEHPSYRPKPSEVQEGTFLLPWIWNLDSASPVLKTVLLLLTVVGWITLWNLSHILAAAFPELVAASSEHWDERHGIRLSQEESNSYNYFGGMNLLPKLVETALDLPEAWVHWCFQATAVFVVLLLVADVMLGCVYNNKTASDPYPSSWKTDNTLCYHDMFSEPSRMGRLLRRPGNTLSNATYLLASLCVLASCYYHSSTTSSSFIFWWADLQFGIMLFLLTLSSCLWHGSNGPWTQYVDIWAMECCILYLIVRNVFGLGLLVVLLQHTNMDLEWAKQVVGGVCAVVYGIAIVMIAQLGLEWYQKGYLHGHCPFSVRAQLLGISNIQNGGSSSGHVDCRIMDVALFASMPVLYYAAPLAVQIMLLKSFGSHTAGDLISRTLVVGWTYRFWDRWILDGHPMMNYLDSMRPSFWRTVGAAVLSPTAVLHAMTGITLLAGYVHSRSLEEPF